MEYSQEVKKIYNQIEIKTNELKNLKDIFVDKKKEEWLSAQDIKLNETIVIQNGNEYLAANVILSRDSYQYCTPYLFGKKRLKSGQFSDMERILYDWEIKK